MKRRDTDPGLEYMISLGFRPARSMSGVREQIANVSDRDRAWAIIEEIDRRAERRGNNQEFYKMKNANYQDQYDPIFKQCEVDDVLRLLSKSSYLEDSEDNEEIVSLPTPPSTSFPEKE